MEIHSKLFIAPDRIFSPLEIEMEWKMYPSFVWVIMNEKREKIEVIRCGLYFLVHEI